MEHDAQLLRRKRIRPLHWGRYVAAACLKDRQAADVRIEITPRAVGVFGKISRRQGVRLRGRERQRPAVAFQFRRQRPRDVMSAARFRLAALLRR